MWRTPLQLLIDLRDKLRSGNESRRVTSSSSGAKPRVGDRARHSLLKRWLVSLNWFPDDKLFWLFPGLRRGLALIRAHGIRHIVVSAPPNSSILLAYALSVLTGARLVIDFRDPWLLRHEASGVAFKPRPLLAAEQALQVRMLRHAAAVVTTNEVFRSTLLGEHDYLAPERVHIVHNGYDSEDFPDVRQERGSDRFRISYLGTFYMQRNPRTFLRALAMFMHEKALAPEDVEVLFIGDTLAVSGSPVRMLVEECGLADVVSISGKVGYARALEIMCESSALLLLAPHQPFQVPAKTYEYMASGRPILALAHEGATADLVRAMGCGIAVEPEDVEGIKTALVRLHENHVNGSQSFACDAGIFERRNQAATLATILERIDA
jgi:glycosyltransferase involved in cell wall biosynthesis